MRQKARTSQIPGEEAVKDICRASRDLKEVVAEQALERRHGHNGMPSTIDFERRQELNNKGA